MMTPVVLLTGFLGAGKTTLLNDLLKRKAFRDTAIIINEAGDIGIDHVLIEKGSDEVVLLEGGCVCCQMRSGLTAALNGLLRRRAVDGLAFKRVIVETSGVADPAALLHAMIADPLFNKHFVLAGVTTVVDAVHLSATLAHHAEALTQIAVADRLLISKADLVGEEGLADVMARLTAINPQAERRVIEPRTRDGSLIWIDPTGRSRHRFPACAVCSQRGFSRYQHDGTELRRNPAARRGGRLARPHFRSVRPSLLRLKGCSADRRRGLCP